MTDETDRTYPILFRADFQEDAKVRYWAAVAGVTREEWLATQLGRAVRGWAAPPPRRAGEAQSEIRTRQRAASPDGMSTFTREIQTIRTTERNQP